MSKNPYAPEFDDLPETLNMFPLNGVLLLPTGQLPLNIFEPRYKAMTEDAMAGSKYIAMVQPQESGDDKNAVYKTGCAGKITEYSETRDGRYLITLTGIARFEIAEELSVNTPYRQVKPDWEPFKRDLSCPDCKGLDRERLYALLKSFFCTHGLTCDWDMIETAEDARLITCLSMICPFSPKEKQALLEAACINKRSETFLTMLEMAMHDGRVPNAPPSKH